MLHGCTQNARDFALGTRMGVLAPRAGLVVVFPEQPENRHSRRCWNWYGKVHQSRGSGEAGELADLVEALQEELGLKPKETFLAGMSAGGAMASNLSHLYPDLFAAVGIHSGLPPKAARGTLGALAAMKGLGLPGVEKSKPTLKIPAIIFHGEKDTVVNPSNGRRIFDSLLQGQPELHQTPTYRRWVEPQWAEFWLIKELAHAWSGGNSEGSHTDAEGPEASREMLRFFGAV